MIFCRRRTWAKPLCREKETSAAEEEIPIAMMEEETVEETQAEEAEESEEAAEAEDAKPAADIHEPRKETAPVEEERPYIFPPITLLGKDPQTGNGSNRSELFENARKLETALKSFSWMQR